MNVEQLQLWSMFICVCSGFKTDEAVFPCGTPSKSLIYCLSILCSGLQDTHKQIQTHLPIHYIFSPSGLTLTPQPGFTQWENTGGGQRSPLLYKTQSKYYNACLVDLQWSPSVLYCCQGLDQDHARLKGQHRGLELSMGIKTGLFVLLH